MSSKNIQEEVISFAQSIIRVNSLSGHEGQVARLIRKKMKTLGYDDVQVDPYGNVIGTKIGKLPGPVVLFDGHMDAVPVTNQEEWSVDPFSGLIRDGKIWGRGASDMKGPLAAAVVAIGHIPRDQFCGTLVVSGSVCEEIHEGAAFSKVLQKIAPDFVVICEPNGCCLGVGQKGRAGLWMEVFGKPSHSSVPHLGENAIYKAMKVIDRLREMKLPSDPFLGNGLMELIDGVSSPYPSQSTLPVSFKMRFDRRLMQNETMESVLESINSALEGLQDWKCDFTNVKIRTYTGESLEFPDFHPGWSIDPESTWIQKAQRGLREGGIEPALMAARFCTNGSFSAGHENIPTMIFGPSSGMLAHCIDENIEISELLQGAEGYTGLAKNLGS